MGGVSFHDFFYPIEMTLVCLLMIVFFVKTGDLIGIVETLLNTSRKTTVIAVRDSEVAKIPAGLIDAIKTRYVVNIK